MMKLTDAEKLLNAFRNKYYTDGNNTENGIIANAINEVLPQYCKLKAENGPTRRKWEYPCQFCGECPVWLSYGEDGGPQTDAELELECKMRGCYLVGRSVFEQDAFESILYFMKEVVRYIETTPEMPPIPKDNHMKRTLDYVSNILHSSGTN